MFLGQIFAKNAKKTLKHFLKRQKRSKNKIRKISVKCAGLGRPVSTAGEVPVFDMFYVISQPFLKIST